MGGFLVEKVVGQVQEGELGVWLVSLYMVVVDEVFDQVFDQVCVQVCLQVRVQVGIQVLVEALEF